MKKFSLLMKDKEDLKHELERKERLSLQAIAARSNMKQHLDEAGQCLKEADKLKVLMTNKLKYAEEEVNYY